MNSIIKDIANLNSLLETKISQETAIIEAVRVHDLSNSILLLLTDKEQLNELNNMLSSDMTKMATNSTGIDIANCSDTLVEINLSSGSVYKGPLNKSALLKLDNEMLNTNM